MPYSTVQSNVRVVYTYSTYMYSRDQITVGKKLCFFCDLLHEASSHVYMCTVASVHAYDRSLILFIIIRSSLLTNETLVLSLNST